MVLASTRRATVLTVLNERCGSDYGGYATVVVPPVVAGILVVTLVVVALVVGLVPV